jgi:hypothetical protein
MGRTVFYICLIAGLIASGIVLLNFNILSQTGQAVKSGAPSSYSGAGKQVVIDYSNLASFLSQNEMVKAIPDGAVISLKFFNFNTGERQWEKSYILTRGNAKEGETNSADISLTLHSKYLKQFNGYNLCSIIKQANANRDLGFESPLSKIKLLWKFKSMYAYRDCLGF